MAYNKKYNYPSLKKPGVYPDGSIKELGLDSDNLEKFSLGNWNSIVKNNRKFFTSEMDATSIGLGRLDQNEDGEMLGRPIKFDNDVYDRHSMHTGYNTIGYFQHWMVYKNEDRTGPYYHIIEPNWIGNNYTTGYIYDLSFLKAWETHNQAYNGDSSQGTYVSHYQLWQESVDAITTGLESRMDELQAILNDNLAYIQPNDESFADNLTKDELVDIPVNFKFKPEVQDQIDEILNNRVEVYLGQSNLFDNVPDIPEEVQMEWYPNGDYDQYYGHVYFSVQLYIEVPTHHWDGTDLYETYPLPIEDTYSGARTEMEAFDTQLTNVFQVKVKTRINDIYSSTLTYNSINDDGEGHIINLGHPNYIISFPLSDENITPNIIPSGSFFNVYTTISNETSENTIANVDSFLFYDINDDRYNDTSYPIEVNLSIGLNGHGDFTNSAEILTNPVDIEIRDSQLLNLFYSEGQEQITLLNEALTNSVAVTDAVYYYKVIQWGDEKSLLTDDAILNTEYFKVYEFEDYPSGVNYHYKRFDKNLTSTQTDFVPIKLNDNLTVTSHVYNKPGVKSIKIIILRFTEDLTILNETILVTKNIVINDGTLLSQDFSIFGGTDFNFLPLKIKDIEGEQRPLEAIIGGLDEDSKYNNSVEKIKKDDNFIQDDYLERASSREFIDNFNKKLYGETPGQLDLSTTRMYKKPLDIYDFINADKLEWITQGSGSLPINSSATDIFISNEDCIVDLNPQDIEYLSIQNKTGTADKAILIGDYKVNQPKDGAVQREGVMQTPLLEQNTDKQAF
jgi:hypothetical protein